MLTRDLFAVANLLVFIIIIIIVVVVELFHKYSVQILY